MNPERSEMKTQLAGLRSLMCEGVVCGQQPSMTTGDVFGIKDINKRVPLFVSGEKMHRNTNRRQHAGRELYTLFVTFEGRKDGLRIISIWNKANEVYVPKSTHSTTHLQCDAPGRIPVEQETNQSQHRRLVSG